MSTIWQATVNAIRAENEERIRAIRKSLGALKNQEGSYAHDHRRILDLREEIGAVIDRHIQEAGS